MAATAEAGLPAPPEWRNTEIENACQRGWPLTPLNGKQPILRDWPRSAVSCENLLAHNGNVGLVTGNASEIIVIDIDGPVDAAILAQFRNTPSVLTARGRHLYFAAPANRTIGNRTGVLPHMDIRGEGGQVVYPGSVHPETGAVYQWAEGLSPEDVPLAPFPLAWYDALSTKEVDTPATENEVAPPVTSKDEAYVLSALESECSQVQSASEGSRNDRFNRAALKLGGLLHSTPHLELHVRERLTIAAHASGLPASEIEATLNSGLEKGKSRPRQHSRDAANLRTVRLADVVAETLQWLWKGRLPRGKLAVLDGDPGLGKSTLTLEIAARLSTGTPLPDGDTPSVCNVAIISAEDGLADTIRPRLEAAEADLSRIIAITAKADGKPLVLPDDVPQIETLLREHGIKLLIIDPLMAFIGDRINTHRDSDVRGILHALADMAERTGCCVLLVRQLEQNTG